MKPSRQGSLMLMAPLLVAAAIGLGLYVVRPFESPIDQAYRLCGECGIEAREVDAFVESKRRSRHGFGGFDKLVDCCPLGCQMLVDDDGQFF